MNLDESVVLCVRSEKLYHSSEQSLMTEAMTGSETLNNKSLFFDIPLYTSPHYGRFTLSIEQRDHCDNLTFTQFFSYIQRCFSLTANTLVFILFTVYTLLSLDYKLAEVKSIETSKIKPLSSVDNQTLYCIQTRAIPCS
jgi:hypothetical protein